MQSCLCSVWFWRGTRDVDMKDPVNRENDWMVRLRFGAGWVCPSFLENPVSSSPIIGFVFNLFLFSYHHILRDRDRKRFGSFLGKGHGLAFGIWHLVFAKTNDITG